MGRLGEPTARCPLSPVPWRGGLSVWPASVRAHLAAYTQRTQRRGSRSVQGAAVRAGGSGLAEPPGTHVPASVRSASLALAFSAKATVQRGCRSAGHHVSVPGSGQGGGGGGRIDSLQHALQKLRFPLLVGQRGAAQPAAHSDGGPGWRGGRRGGRVEAVPGPHAAGSGRSAFVSLSLLARTEFGADACFGVQEGTD